MLFQFGLFTLDPIHRQVSYAGRLLSLPPKVFEVLLCLVKHARIVTKEELRDAVWPGVNVSEANLTQTVFLLRHKLKTLDPRDYIVTVPHRGYQLTAEVKRSDPSVINDRPASGNSGNNGCTTESRFMRSVCGLLSTRTARSLSTAIRWCERARRHDPTNTAACINLANAYCLSMSVGGIVPGKALSKIQAAVLTALEINSNAHAAFAPLGYLRCHFDHDWRRAELDFQGALEKCPGDLLAYHWYGEFLTAFQRFDEALAVLRRAQEIHPASLLIHTDIAQTFFYAREYRDCEAQVFNALEFDPGFSRAWLMLGGAYARLGDYKKALSALDHCAGEETYATVLAVRADTYGSMGKIKEARQSCNQLRELSAKRYVSPYVLGFAGMATGEINQAFSLFDQASRERDHWLLWLKVKPNLDHVRDDPRFQRLLEKTNLVPANQVM